MGVPKFFRWVAERYPSVITPFRESPPPIDNLYLDMNGIIHNCTHPNDIDATRKSATEKEMVQAMYTYLEKLFNVIQPRKYFVLAVDGVAPRAKMNQQRQRRFRSAYEMMVAREEALARGEELPEESDVFDSNCITPGTDFMVRISEQFKYFISMKLSTDAAWQNCKVIFSGHDHPGEGEHKIVDFIRRRKWQPDYSPNETHCMYGLDADLVMLALATHEPHFVLLREVVSFGAGAQSRAERERKEEDQAKGLVVDKSYQNVDEFVLFHINILRECLDIDVREKLKKKLPKDYDLERMVDDYIFMCFFIGNDFLPSLPTLGIVDGSMLTMLQLYCDTILSEGLYMTNMGEVNWSVAERWLNKIATLEFDTIKTRQEQEENHQRQLSRRDPTREAPVKTIPFEGITDYKQHFYRNKHGFANGWDPTGAEMNELRLHYLEGISWVIGYYYNGPPSWKWFFPHHYAPMASDLVNLPAIAAKVKFDKGKPFFPHQQLLAVLPPMSYRSIPRAYWPLLKSASSPLQKYLPDHITIDREGARAPWEGIVLIPFLDEKTLLLAYESVQRDVTPEDAKNNQLGEPILFQFSESVAPYDVPNEHFGPLRQVKISRTTFVFPPIGRFVPKLCPGVHIGERQLEGFASLYSKRDWMTPLYDTGSVTIFGAPTKRESMLLCLSPPEEYSSVEELASLVGTEVFVAFPHYKRARIASISDRWMNLQALYTQEGTFCGIERKELNRDDSAAFQREAETHKQYMKAKLGIAVESVRFLVYVHRFSGMRVTRKGRIVRNFTKAETCYPLQLICRPTDINVVEDMRYQERDRAEGDAQLGSKVLFIGPEPKNKKLNAQVYGSHGFVVDQSRAQEDTFTVAVRVYTRPQPIPQSLQVYATASNWLVLHEVAEELGVSSLALTLISGSLVTSPAYGSQELGLCLAFRDRNLARVGYSKLTPQVTNPWYIGNADIFTRMEDDSEAVGHHLARIGKNDFAGRSSNNKGGRGKWYFSREAVSLLKKYVAAFTPLIKRLEAGGANCNSLEPQEFMTGSWATSTPEEVLKSIESFIKESMIMEVPMINAGEDAFTRSHLRELEEELDAGQPRPFKEFHLKAVSRRHLYFPITRSIGGHLVPLPLPKEQLYRIGARVVYCQAAGGVPFGAVGTIVRILATGQSAEVVYDEPFIGGTRLDGRLQKARGAITKLSYLLVVSDKGGDASTEGEKAASGVAAVARPTHKDPATSPLALAPQVRGTLSPAKAVAVGGGLPATAPGVASSPSMVVTGGPSGIRVADLVGKLSTSSPAQSASQSVPSPTPVTSTPVAPAATLPGVAAVVGPEARARDAKSAGLQKGREEEQPARSREKPDGNLRIPEAFVSGQSRVRIHDVMPMFDAYLSRCLQNELEKIKKKI